MTDDERMLIDVATSGMERAFGDVKRIAEEERAAREAAEERTEKAERERDEALHRAYAAESRAAAAESASAAYSETTGKALAGRDAARASERRAFAAVLFLWEALKKYGQHRAGCAIWGGTKGDDCTCGLDAVFKMGGEGKGHTYEEWARAAATSAGEYVWEFAERPGVDRKALSDGVEQDVYGYLTDAVLDSPPAFDAEAVEVALAEAFEWCERQDHPGETSREWWRALAQRWIRRE